MPLTLSKASTLITVLLMVLSFQGHALCENSELSFEVYLNNTLDSAYENDGLPTPFEAGDFVVVTDTVFGISYKLEEGTLSDDGAGNFGITADLEVYGRKIEVDIFHDHETWHEGLEGTIEYLGNEYDLKEITNCSFDDLFQ